MVYNKSKFKNKITVCSKKHRHLSLGEARHCENLHMIMTHSRDCDYNRIVVGPTYIIRCNGVKVCTHKPDFELWYDDKLIRIEEYKGVRTAVFNLKLKLFKANYPEIKYVLVFKK